MNNEKALSVASAPAESAAVYADKLRQAYRSVHSMYFHVLQMDDTPFEWPKGLSIDRACKLAFTQGAHIGKMFRSAADKLGCSQELAEAVMLLYTYYEHHDHSVTIEYPNGIPRDASEVLIELLELYEINDQRAEVLSNALDGFLFGVWPTK